MASLDGSTTSVIGNLLVQDYVLLGNESEIQDGADSSATASTVQSENSSNTLVESGENGSINSLVATHLATGDLATLEEGAYQRLAERKEAIQPFIDNMLNLTSLVLYHVSQAEYDHEEYQDSIIKVLGFVRDKSIEEDLDFTVSLMKQVMEVVKTVSVAKLRIFPLPEGADREEVKTKLLEQESKELKAIFFEMLQSLVLSKIKNNITSFNEEYLTSLCQKMCVFDSSHSLATYRRMILQAMVQFLPLFNEVQGHVLQLASEANNKRDIGVMMDDIKNRVKLAKETVMELSVQLQILDTEYQLAVSARDALFSQIEADHGELEESYHELKEQVDELKKKLLDAEDRYHKAEITIATPYAKLVELVEVNELAIPSLIRSDPEVQVQEEVEEVIDHLGACDIVEKMKRLITLVSSEAVDDLGDSRAEEVRNQLLAEIDLLPPHSIHDGRIESSAYYKALYEKLIAAIESQNAEDYEFYSLLLQEEINCNHGEGSSEVVAYQECFANCVGEQQTDSIEVEGLEEVSLLTLEELEADASIRQVVLDTARQRVFFHETFVDLNGSQDLDFSSNEGGDLPPGSLHHTMNLEEIFSEMIAAMEPVGGPAPAA